MSQQPLNLRRSVQIVRRHRILVSALTITGLIAGAGYAAVKGPTYTTTALVVIPSEESSAISSQSGANAAANAGDLENTQVVIATSVPVLTKALSGISPSVTLDALQGNVSAANPASGVISITAKGKSAAQAESEANQVASAYVAYLGSADNAAGSVSARVLQQASTATGTSAVSEYGMTGVLGLLVGLLIGVIAAIILSRRDRKLRTLDDIAGALGVPVLAAVPVEHPTDAAGWTRVLDSYDPAAVHAWRLRQVLQEIGLGSDRDRAAGPVSVTVLSPTSDPDALALGPQLASLAASLGIPTVLAIGPAQDSVVTAALHTACAGWSGGSSRASHLRAIAADGGRFSVPNGAGLVVQVLAVDAKQQQIPETMPTSSTVVGVSAGGATAEQLARIATAAAADGRDVAGILVADPESADQSTGRIAPLTRTARHASRPATAFQDAHQTTGP